MGTNNRQRRAAKKRARDRAQTHRAPGRGFGGDRGAGGPSVEDVLAEVFDGIFDGMLDEVFGEVFESPPSITAELVAAAAAEIAMSHAQGDPDALAAGVAVLTGHPEVADEVVDRGLALATSEALGALWVNGWLPLDVAEHARRGLSAASAELLGDLMAAQIGGYAAATMHPRWRASAAAAGVDTDRAQTGPVVTGWARRHDRSREDTLSAALGVLGFCYRAPTLPEIVPPPGRATAQYARAQPAAAPAGADPKVLARVRGLLAKAEATTYPEEAEALSAKAGELMNRHALARAVVDAATQPAQTAITVRLWLEGPYVPAKSMLVAAVAVANRCVCVRSESVDMVSIVGHETDLETVEMLTTSLLVQANQAMLATGRASAAGGRARSRSFRQSFLLAYAGRIGERLQQTAAAAADELADDRLLPVLTERASAVNDTLAEVFGPLGHSTIAINDPAGWHAGRAAADTATLGPDRDPIAQRA